MKLKIAYLKAINLKAYSNVPHVFVNYSAQVHGGKFNKKAKIKLFNKSLKFGINIFTRKPFYYPSKKLMKKLK